MLKATLAKALDYILTSAMEEHAKTQINIGEMAPNKQRLVLEIMFEVADLNSDSVEYLLSLDRKLYGVELV